MREETWGSAEGGLVVTASGAGDAVVVRLEGELDLGGTQLLADALAAATTPPPAAIEVDLAQLSFIDSAGLAGLVRAGKECADRGVGFRVTAMSAAVARIVELAGLEGAFGPQ